MFDVDNFIADLEQFNKENDRYLNLTEGEKELEDLRQAVNQLKEDRKAKEEANRKARKMAVDKVANTSVDKYVAMCEAKKKEFKQSYF